MAARACGAGAAVVMMVWAAPCLARADQPPPKAPALVGSVPSADSVALGAPGIVELDFSQPVRPGASHIAVRNAAGQRMDRGDVHVVTDATHLAVTLKPLVPGHYVVAWGAAPRSGQAAKGSFGFTVGR